MFRGEGSRGRCLSSSAAEFFSLPSSEDRRARASASVHPFAVRSRFGPLVFLSLVFGVRTYIDFIAFGRQKSNLMLGAKSQKATVFIHKTRRLLSKSRCLANRQSPFFLRGECFYVVISL